MKPPKLLPRGKSLVKRVVHGRPRTKPLAGYPMVTARVSKDAEHFPGVSNAIREYGTISANFPFSLYSIVDTVSVIDPYISRFIHQTVSLGNPGHKLYLQARNEARADEAIKACNEFAGRCFPFGGGMDGVVSGMLHQEARTGALCVEWVPDKGFNQIERGFLVPIRTLRFRYADDKGTIELVQMMNDGKMQPLQPLQTTYHALTLRDSNPYPIPPIVSALEASTSHRQIMRQIGVWVQKVSALGVMTASVTPPPRIPGKSQEEYDVVAQQYLNAIAESVAQNLEDGLAVGYDNINFTFNNTQAGAQGAKDLLQLVVQGLFSALQRDPIFFGWNMGSTETLARIVYQEMMQSLKLYQIGPKRALEHGHRLNLAFTGFGDVAVSVRFKEDTTVDAFKEAEAAMMKTQAIISQYEAQIINLEEARKLLGHEQKGIESGSYVAAFNREANIYELESYRRKKWAGTDLDNGETEGEENESGSENREDFGNPEQPDGGRGKGLRVRPLRISGAAQD